MPCSRVNKVQDLENEARRLHGEYLREALDMARRYSMDFTDQEEFGDFPPFLAELNGPAGVYGAKITRVEDGEDRNGKPLQTVWWAIEFGPIGHPLFNQFNKSAITQRVSFHENAYGAVMHFLHMIGEPYKGQVQIDLDRWIGKKARIKVKIEQPEGYDRMFHQVEQVYEWKPHEDDKLAATPSSSSTPASSPKMDEHGPTEPAPPDNPEGWADDIPF